MPIDPRVPLGAISNSRSAFDMDLFGMANQAALLQARRQALAEQERARQDEQAQRAIWQESGGNPEKAAQLFRQRGFGEAAQKVETHIADLRKKRTDELKTYLDNQKATFDIVRGLAGSITNEATHRIALDIAQKVSPQFVPILGETYDEGTIAAMQQWGMDQTARVELEKKTLDALVTGVKAPQDAIALAAGLLKTAQHPQQYQEYYAALTELMPGPLRGQVMGLFPPNYSPEAVAAAQRIAGATSEQKGGTSDYAQFLKRYATKLGKPVEALTADEELEARKQYGRADDAAKSYAPIVVVTPQGPMVTTDNSRSRVAPIIGPDNQPIANKLPGAMIEKVAGLENVGDILGRVRETYNADWVGPAVGRYNETVRLNTPGRDLPAGMANFATNLAAVKNWFVKAITGAQMSEPEAKRIMAQIPKWSDKPELFNANLEASERNAAFLANRIMQLSGARGGGQQPPPSNVSQLLSGKGPGRYTLSDGSVWEKAQSGALTKVK